MFIGMDGGGTSSDFILLDANGRILARHNGGSAYYLEVGMDGVRELMATGVAALLKAAGLTSTQVDFAFFGLPIYGEDQRTGELDALPAAVLPAAKFACGNDMVCGWAGSLACRDGINVIAGTGSICYGEWERRTARCGGWGELFSDEGSAFWIARHGLALFSKMSDGRMPRGPLYEAFKSLLGGRPDIELTAWVLEELSRGRSKVAALSKLVMNAAELGDPAAQGIFDSAAFELAQLVIAVRRLLEIPSEASVDVSYSGGIFSIGERVTRPFKAALQSGGAHYQLVVPRYSPVVGAALNAARMRGQPLTAAALSRLDRESARFDD